MLFIALRLKNTKVVIVHTNGFSEHHIFLANECIYFGVLVSAPIVTLFGYL